MDKQEYHPPQLVEYGTLEQLTLGSTGPSLDFSFGGGILTISNDCPKGHICVAMTS